MAPARLSGLAKQVLSLHRSLLRAARSKDATARAAISRQIRDDFERHARLDPRKDVLLVEHLIRAGNKKLAMLRDPNVVGARWRDRGRDRGWRRESAFVARVGLEFASGYRPRV